jgi:matrixin
VRESSRVEKRIACIRVACVAVFASTLLAAPVSADPIGLQWPQPHGKGTDVVITYSYANLFDGTFLLITPRELRAATEEALGVWASYAPLHFVERPDSGPPVSDQPYAADGHPQIRVGQHDLSEVAHGFYPGSDGLAGDVHFASGLPWTVGEGHWNYLEAVTHELGHALGLVHELDEIAVMNPSYPSHRFDGLGSARLYPADIRQLQGIYGAGIGSVQPLSATPEPGTLIFVVTGVLALATYRLRRRNLRVSLGFRQVTRRGARLSQAAASRRENVRPRS